MAASPFLHVLRAVLVASIVLLLAACGSRPLPPELASLDALNGSQLAIDMRANPSDIEDPNIRELREQSGELVRSSDSFHRLAMDAFGSRKDDIAILLARTGLIYYQAAENFFRSADARDRLNDANARFEEQRLRRNDYRSRLQSETELISLLETVQRLFEANEQLRRQLATFEESARGEARALYAIQEARVLQREAQGSRADRYAASDYDVATASLARAQGLFDAGNHENAYQAALESVEQYRRALENARPSFMQDQDRVLRNADTRQLYDDTQRVFGNANAFIDARGLVVVLPDLFEAGRDTVKPSRTFLLDEMTQLLNQYSRVTITIEGHTSDEGANEINQSVSQNRADAVKTYFTQRNIGQRRIRTSAFGEEAPRFDNSTPDGRVQNDRVEIVFGL